jgi:pyruvate dehydrogenase phosphatase
MSHDVLSSEDSNPQGPSKDNPSAVFNGIRKDLDKLGKDINDLPDAPGIDNDLSALEKISKDLALLGKGLEELQKSVEALRKDTDAPQSDDDQVMHQALTTHAASAERASTLSSFPGLHYSHHQPYHPTNFPTSNSPSEDHIASTFCHLPTLLVLLWCLRRTQRTCYQRLPQLQPLQRHHRCP